MANVNLLTDTLQLFEKQLGDLKIILNLFRALLRFVFRDLYLDLYLELYLE